jgi:hypothetical protein
MNDILWELKNIIREIRYDKTKTKYMWTIDELEKLVADIEAQIEREHERFAIVREDF